MIEKVLAAELESRKIETRIEAYDEILDFLRDYITCKKSGMISNNNNLDIIVKYKKGQVKIKLELEEKGEQYGNS